MASVTCSLFAQCSKEGLLSSVARYQHSKDPVHKRKGRMFKEYIPLVIPGENILRCFFVIKRCFFQRNAYIFSVTTVKENLLSPLSNTGSYWVCESSIALEMGIRSYETIHKWPRQQHFISNAHRDFWSTCMISITQRDPGNYDKPWEHGKQH